MKNLCFLALVLVLAGCTASDRGEEGSQSSAGITLMTWNIHNLFDGSDDGYEYDEFKQSAGWSQEKYLGRLNSISAAVDRIESRPDVIILQEIESLKVLEDLALSMKGGYSNSYFAHNHGAAVGLGILSRLPLSEVKAHSVTIDGQTAPRPVLEAKVQAGEGAFVVFACHWKSKIGGDDVTESVRRASARLILRRIRELWEEEEKIGVIVAGDLNENYDEFFRQGASTICALLPDDPRCAELTGGRQTDFIVISGNMPPAPAHFPNETVVLFSPWLSVLENGSYFYKNDWETIDHFLISSQFFDNAGLEYESALIVNFEPFAKSNGTPFSYNARTGSGFSDHFPLLITLRMAFEE